MGYDADGNPTDVISDIVKPTPSVGSNTVGYIKVKNGTKPHKCKVCTHSLKLKAHKEVEPALNHEQKMNNFKGEIKRTISELQQYELMSALVVNEQEYLQYKSDVNDAIAANKLNPMSLNLPSKPKWFI